MANAVTPTAQSMGIRASRSSEKTHHNVCCRLGCGSAAIAGLRRSRGRSHEEKFPMVCPDTLEGATRVDGGRIRKEKVVDERLNWEAPREFESSCLTNTLG